MGSRLEEDSLGVRFPSSCKSPGAGPDVFPTKRSSPSFQGGPERGAAGSHGRGQVVLICEGCGGGNRPRLCSVNGSTRVVTSSGGNMLGE